MRHLYAILVLLACSLLSTSHVSAQYTNRGKDFWVGYQRTNGFSSGSQYQMVIYLSAINQTAHVNIEIVGTSGTPWVRQYTVPANSTIQSDNIPSTGANNATLPAAGLYAKQGIHITSDVPIAAYAHIYESANSGATLLLPSDVWGYEYFTMNNQQDYPSAGITPSATVFHIVAKDDSTWVEINPSVPTTLGWTRNGGTQPNGSYLVKLNKGDVYQVLGSVLSGTKGQDLTGSSVKVIPNNQSVKNPIALYCGSTRTSILCGAGGGSSSGDLIIQQMFSYQMWGTKYATAPFSRGIGITAYATSVYRVMVKDVTTIVKRNGTILPSAQMVNGFYQFESNTADLITADKPILVAQYMVSGGNCTTGAGDLGDPEMIYLTPITAAIPQTSFYRNHLQAIDQTHLTLIIPTAGMSSLKIDGVPFSSITSNTATSPHPNLPGYTVVRRKYAAGPGQSYVESNYAFTGYTYGIGSVESYGYNLGMMYDSLNIATVKYNTIRGTIFLDANKNGIKDNNENWYPFAKLKTVRPGIDSFNTYTYNGMFSIYVDSGTYVNSVQPFSPYYTAVPVTDTSYFGSYFLTDSIGFAIQPILNVRDLAITMAAISPARPGFTAQYRLVYANKGTDTADAVIALAKSTKMSFASSSVSPVSVTADTVKWNISSIPGGAGGYIDVNFLLNIPPSLNAGDTLRMKALITSNKTDSVPADNIFLFNQRVTGPYDPNDKAESHAGQIPKSTITNGELLNYTIRFQNVGTDAAINVVVRDTLNAKLDWNTLKMVNASHHYQLIVDGGVAVWSFNNINLPDSNTNEPLSHGFINFTIQPKASVNINDVISNKASIYFDHNLPVVTNTVSTTVTNEVLPVILMQFTAVKKPGYNLLEWSVAQQSNFSHFEIERGNGQEFAYIGKMNGGKDRYSFIDNNFPKAVNYYRLKMVDNDGKFQYSPVQRLNNGNAIDIVLYPNPAKDVANLRIESLQQKTLQYSVLSADGRILQSGKINVSAGLTIAPLSIASLSPGVYFIRVDVKDESAVIIKLRKE